MSFFRYMYFFIRDHEFFVWVIGTAFKVASYQLIKLFVELLALGYK